MDWNRLDRARRAANPYELDLIEHYAAGRISRRDFVKRGAILGLGTTAMASVIAACGSDDGTSDAGSDGGDTDNGGDDGGSAAPASDNAGVVDRPAFAAGGVVSVAVQPSSSGLDPVNMLDQATYNICSQSFEYLVGVGADGNIDANSLSTGWSVNDAGDVWTFDLREGVKWHSGEDFTSADVAATMDRLATAENAGLDGVIDVGSVDASDPAKAVIQLINPNGNFPVLVSNFNAQSLITPASYETGTLLDQSPAGTGAWMLESYDPSDRAVFVKNPDWWGGETLLDGVEIVHFDTIDTMVTAVQSGEVDAIQQFAVIGGEGLLDNSDFIVLTPPASTHRQMWFNTQVGQFTDKLVRQALAWTLDRDRMISTLFNGRAVLGNDHPVLSSLPFYDPDAVEQRSRNMDRAAELLAEAGVEGLSSVINCGNVQEVPDLAALVQQDSKDAGFDLTIEVHPQDTFYSDSWCPESAEGEPPCINADEFGIVDWGHRPVPDVFLTSALQSDAVWNASVYADADYDAMVTEYQSSLTVEDQKTAIGKIQAKLWEDVPAIYPYFYNYLSGHRTNVAGMQSTALGHSMLTAASKEA